jgi:hypothetical protein
VCPSDWPVCVGDVPGSSCFEFASFVCVILKAVVVRKKLPASQINIGRFHGPRVCLYDLPTGAPSSNSSGCLRVTVRLPSLGCTKIRWSPLGFCVVQNHQASGVQFPVFRPLAVRAHVLDLLGDECVRFPSSCVQSQQTFRTYVLPYVTKESAGISLCSFSGWIKPFAVDTSNSSFSVTANHPFVRR